MKIIDGIIKKIRLLKTQLVALFDTKATKLRNKFDEIDKEAEEKRRKIVEKRK